MSSLASSWYYNMLNQALDIGVRPWKGSKWFYEARSPGRLPLEAPLRHFSEVGEDRAPGVVLKPGLLWEPSKKYEFENADGEQEDFLEQRSSMEMSPRHPGDCEADEAHVVGTVQTNPRFQPVVTKVGTYPREQRHPFHCNPASRHPLRNRTRQSGSLFCHVTQRIPRCSFRVYDITVLVCLSCTWRASRCDVVVVMLPTSCTENSHPECCRIVWFRSSHNSMSAQLLRNHTVNTSDMCCMCCRCAIEFQLYFLGPCAP